ncbi:MAG: hypothetical protein IE916_00570 [Epsilonproteobacteria bacterium]|nr:hypothetical protein [Campylobacterota bacterium]
MTYGHELNILTNEYMMQKYLPYRQAIVVAEARKLGIPGKSLISALIREGANIKNALIYSLVPLEKLEKVETPMAEKELVDEYKESIKTSIEKDLELQLRLATPETVKKEDIIIANHNKDDIALNTIKKLKS